MYFLQLQGCFMVLLLGGDVGAAVEPLNAGCIVSQSWEVKQQTAMMYHELVSLPVILIVTATVVNATVATGSLPLFSESHLLLSLSCCVAIVTADASSHC